MTDRNFDADRLRSFETQVANDFNAARIRAPVHLYSGNEEEMIRIFEEIEEEDWVLCSWRSHYQCLLKGVPEDTLRKEILEGRSISLCFAEQRIYSSAIVGGNVPIAVGVAMGIKLRGEARRVHCFVGDMTSETGIFHECVKYSENHDLPVRFIVEDNSLSVCTDTREAWGSQTLSYEGRNDARVVYYRYKTSYPHAGAGVRVQF